MQVVYFLAIDFNVNNFFFGSDHSKFAKADMERRASESTIFLFDYYDIDGTFKVTTKWF